MSCYVIGVSHKNLLLIEENPQLCLPNNLDKIGRDSQQAEINKIFLSLEKTHRKKLRAFKGNA